MTPEGVVQVVNRVFAAAGRRAGEVDYEVWGDALSSCDDGLAVEAARQLVREADLTARAASPNQVIQLYRRLAAKRLALPPAPEPEVDREQALTNIAELKELLRTKGPKRWP